MSDRIITGIDIGTSKISVAISSQQEDQSEPRVLGFAQVVSRGVKRGQIVDINAVTESIEKAVEAAERMAGMKVQQAYVSIGGPHIESLNSQGVVAVSSPSTEIAPDDVARVIDAAKAISLASNREIVEVIAREFIVDGQGGIKNPIGMSGVRLEVNTHIITASVTNLKNIERCLSDLGISIQSYIFSGLASALSSLTETEKELGVVLVDIGGGKMDMCIYVEGALSYSSSIPLGARHVTNDIAVGLRVSLESAEKVKVYLSSKRVDKQFTPSAIKSMTKAELSSADDVDISHLKLPEGLNTISYKMVIDGIIRPRLEEMFMEVMNHVDRSGFATAVPSGLVITGGGALTVGLLDASRRVIGLPARIGVPQGLTGLVDELLYPQYATTAGLLLYALSITEEHEGMNFKDFDKILRNFTPNISMKKVTDLFKSFLP